MKIGLISDTHLNLWKNFNSPGKHDELGLSKRLYEQSLVLDKAISIFKENNVALIVHGGDWVHSVGVIQNEALNVIREFLIKVDSENLPLATCAGNHDTNVRVSPKSAHLFTNIIDGLLPNGLVDFIFPEYTGKVKIKLISYFDTVDYEEIKGYDLVVLHKQPVGCKVGGHEFTDGVNWKTLAKNNKFVAFGHIHEMQVLAQNCIVIGSPMPFTFGDLGDHGVWTFDTETKETVFHKIDSPQFITVDKDEDVKDDYNYYRVLNSKGAIHNNAVSVVVPEYFEERIKSTNFDAILDEWLKINDKDVSYKNVLENIISDKFQFGLNVFDGKITSVSIKNFCSIGDIEYNVNNGFTLITGEGDIFDSNGVGKSTATGESICWCLFGETSKGLTGDDVIRRGEKDCVVSIKIANENNGYEISRTRKKGLIVTDITTAVVLTEGMRKEDAQNTLENLLGFDINIFKAACYFSQEGLTVLTGLGDADRTNMVTRLLGFEKYSDLYKKVVVEIDKCTRQKDLIVSRDKQLENDIRVLVSELNGFKDRLKENEQEVERKRSQIADLKDQLQKLEHEERTSVAIPDKDFDIEINALSKEQDIYSEQLSVKNPYTTQLFTIKNKKSITETNLRRNEQDIAKIENEINKLNNQNFGSRCDKCGSIIAKENISIFVDERKKTIDELIKIGSDLQHEYDLAVKEISAVDNLVAKYDESLVESKRNLNTVVAKIRELQNQKSEYNEQKKRTAVLESEHRVKTTQLLSRTNAAQQDLQELDKRILDILEQCVERKNEIKAKEREVLTLREESILIDETVNKLDFWKVAFSPKGIPSVLLDKFCNDFNAIVNKYLSFISSGSMSVVISPTKQLKGGEERNKIGITVRLDNKESKYESLSGGEKRRVDISLCFALSKYVSKENGVLGLVIMDETFSFLDTVGSEGVADLLCNEGKSKAVFVIDHALDLGSYADNVWKVVKKNGISSLVK